jgi:hypothetical protein
MIVPSKAAEPSSCFSPLDSLAKQG